MTLKQLCRLHLACNHFNSVAFFEDIVRFSEFPALAYLDLTPDDGVNHT